MRCEVLDSGWPDLMNAPTRPLVNVLAWHVRERGCFEEMPASIASLWRLMYFYVFSLVFIPTNSGRSSTIRPGGTLKDSFIHVSVRTIVPSINTRSSTATFVKLQTSVAFSPLSYWSFMNLPSVCSLLLGNFPTRVCLFRHYLAIVTIKNNFFYRFHCRRHSTKQKPHFCSALPSNSTD